MTGRLQEENLPQLSAPGRALVGAVIPEASLTFFLASC